MEIDQQIKYLITVTTDGNQREFAKKIGVKPQTINNLINRKGAPSFKMIQQILSAFPQIDPNWLILGKGSIGTTFKKDYLDNNSGYTEILSEPQATYNAPNAPSTLYLQRIAALEREVELLEKIIEEKDVLIAHLKQARN